MKKKTYFCKTQAQTYESRMRRTHSAIILVLFELKCEAFDSTKYKLRVAIQNEPIPNGYSLSWTEMKKIGR